MKEYLMIGSGFALAAALQPGPLQAYLLASVMQRGWRRTLVACLSPVLSDGPIALLVLLLLDHLPSAMNWLLQAVGGLFLLFLAWKGFRQWRRPGSSAEPLATETPRTLLQAVLVNLLNPNPYLGWSLVLGPAAITAWHQGPANAVVLVVAFYATMVTGLAATVLFFGTTRLLGAKGQRLLLPASAALLFALGGYQLQAAISLFLNQPG